MKHRIQRIKKMEPKKWARLFRRNCNDGSVYRNQRTAWDAAGTTVSYTRHRFELTVKELERTPGTILVFLDKVPPDTEDKIGWRMTEERASDTELTRHRKQQTGRVRGCASMAEERYDNATSQEQQKLGEFVAKDLPDGVKKEAKTFITTMAGKGVLIQKGGQQNWQQKSVQNRTKRRRKQ
jgi:hypothetical protein